MKNMSFALTTRQYQLGRKTVTRRVGWAFLKPNDTVMGVKKGMGLKKGEKIKRLGAFYVISVRREALSRLLVLDQYSHDEMAKEGFPWLSPQKFVEFFIKTHKGCTINTEVTRIEFTRITPMEDQPCH